MAANLATAKVRNRRSCSNVLSKWALVACAAQVGLSGCAGLYPHDAERAAATAGIAKNLDAVRPELFAKDRRSDLQKLLQYEVDALAERKKASLALYAHVISQPSAEVGVESPSPWFTGFFRDTRARFGDSSKPIDIGALLASGRIPASVEMRQKALAESIEEIFGSAALDSSCPKSDKLSEYIDQRKRALQGTPVPGGGQVWTAELLDEELETYKAECEGINKAREEVMIVGPELKSTANALAEAKAKVSARVNVSKSRQKALQSAKNAFDKAMIELETAQGTGAATEKRLRDSAARIKRQLDRLAKVAPEAASDSRLSALADLLGAAGDGSESAAKSASSSLVVASAIPGLANAWQQSRTVLPPVSHLLLALNHELAEAEKIRAILAVEKRELALLEERGRLLRSELSSRVRTLRLVCKMHTGSTNACQQIDLIDDEKPNARFELTAKDPLNGSAVSGVFKKSLPELESGPPTGKMTAGEVRELAISLLESYQSAFDIALNGLYATNLIHEKMGIEHESAYRQWFNLTQVPTKQLEHYYAGGVKPAEIADLLLKALGVTGIAIGVSK